LDKARVATVVAQVAMVLKATEMPLNDSMPSVQRYCALNKPNWMRSKIGTMIWYVLPFLIAHTLSEGW
jgi:hypothetical protein